MGNRVPALVSRPQGIPGGWGLLLWGYSTPRLLGRRIGRLHGSSKHLPGARWPLAVVLKGQLPARGERAG